MKIFSVSQIKQWDQFTIENEPVNSIELMERAANECFFYILSHYSHPSIFKIFCGKGNNGGDGLAIARLLTKMSYQVSVYIAGKNKPGSPDFEANLERLKTTTASIDFLEEDNVFPNIDKKDILIDALFGTGLNKPVTGYYAELVRYINQNASTVISIDIPSGLYVDKSSVGNPAIQATTTLSFQNQKLAFLLPENQPYTGRVILLNIELSPEFQEKEQTPFVYLDEKEISRIYKKREPFSNKGNYGYACLLAGSYGMMGAAVLSSKACLKSGAGKLTSYICGEGYEIFQTSVPEAMCKTFGNTFIEGAKGFDSFDAIGFGPGLGLHESYKNLFHQIFSEFKKPLVIDADALNFLSENQELYKEIPPESIITPHPKEFERLFGKSSSDFDRMHLALSKAKEFNIYIVLKGHHTFIASPDQRGFFNSTGNAGMATAGAGDVLTGILTGLLAQKYHSLDACILGVYLHGLAGDFAAETESQESMIAGDIIDNLGKAFKKISSGYSG